MAKPSQDRAPGGHRADPHAAEERRAAARHVPSSASACVVAVLIVGAARRSGPIKDWWDMRKFNGIALDKIGAPASVVPEEHDQAGRRQPAARAGRAARSSTTTRRRRSASTDSDRPTRWQRKFYTEGDRPELGALVHNLEHGYTILWYDETVADDADQMDRARGIADKFAGTSNLRYKFKAVPWTETDGKRLPRRPARRVHALVDRRRRRGPVRRRAGRRLAVLLGRLGRGPRTTSC